MSSDERMNAGRPWMARRVIAAVLCGAVTGLLVAPLPSFAQGTAPLPELVKDMFTGTAGLTPSGWPPGRPRRVANVDGALYMDVYFNDLSDGASQPQNSVWRSDGTAGGTVPSYWPTSVNGRLFLTDVYSTDCPVTGGDCFEVWKADRSGWPETLVMKLDFHQSLLGAPRVAFPLDLNGSLFFVTYKDWLGTSLEPSITVSNLWLWSSDGTEQGTGSFYQFVTSSAVTVGSLVVVGHQLFFLTTIDNTTTLWRTDGTQAGTFPLKTSMFRGYFESLTKVGATLYFVFNDPTLGRELWKSDGTVSGTMLVKDITPGPDSSFPGSLLDVGGYLYFRATAGGQSDSELWRSDGTAAGTVLVKDIGPGVSGSRPHSFCNVNGTLYFIALGWYPRVGLWRSDGSATGTVLVKSFDVPYDAFYPASDGPVPFRYALTNVNGRLFFVVPDPVVGAELWTSDGSPAGTVMVADINPGPASSYPTDLTAVNATLFFLATDGATGDELWRSDGTPGGTRQVIDLNTAPAASSPVVLGSRSGTLLLSVADDSLGREVWRSDGTPGGTAPITDIRLGLLGSSPSNAVALGTSWYFGADDGEHGQELWRTDGTAGGTSMVKDIGPYPTVSTPDPLASVGGLLFFTANDPWTGRELWRSDGTAAGTELVKDIRPGTASALSQTCRDWAVLNGHLFFIADDGLTGAELWRSDGTAAGTSLVRDTAAGAGSAFTACTGKALLRVVGGTLFFVAADPAAGQFGLWKTDGSAAGTALLKQWPLVNSGGLLPTNTQWPVTLVDVGGTLFFAAAGALWRSDGTPAGTVPVYTFPSSSFVGQVVNSNGTLLFVVANAFQTQKLWKSDGTPAGTVFVKELFPGVLSANARDFTVVNGTLYFAANDYVHGRELWRSDGTATGTVLVMDLLPGPASSMPSSLVNVNGTLYFIADDGVHGRELWRIGPGAGTPRARRDFDGDGKTDATVFRPSSGAWYQIRSSTRAAVGTPWGQNGDTPVPADHDGDGKSDLAVFRPAAGTWFIVQSSTGAALGIPWGTATDTPVPADYDGDGKADVAVFRPAAGTWYIVQSSTGTPVGVPWGQVGDIPVPADYDGDGRTDVAVFRPAAGTWYIVNSATNTVTGRPWGQQGDTPIAADFDGDGRADPTVFRAGTWFQLRSTTGAMGFSWGTTGDVPLAGDYDGDGKADPTVFRGGTWYQLRSTTGAGGFVWGAAGDLPQ